MYDTDPLSAYKDELRNALPSELAAEGIIDEAISSDRDTQNYLKLLDTQARHAQVLKDEDVLWRAALELDHNEYSVRLDDSQPYRVCVFHTTESDDSGGIHNSSGVRFLQNVFSESEDMMFKTYYWDIPVIQDGMICEGFGELAVEVVSRLIGELRLLDVPLSNDLAFVRRPLN